MKNMKLGAKIGLGFGLLIVIALILGGMAVINMKGVSEESTMLAREYVPEVKVGTEIRGAANRVMYAMSGYGFTENEKYLNDAQQELAALTETVGEGRALDEKADHLTKLKGQLDQVEKEKEEYTTAVQSTVEAVQTLDILRREMDKAAALYMNQSDRFLKSQNRSFREDLAERGKKIDIITELLNLGSGARVMNFKAQSLEDPGMMEKAADRLAGVPDLVRSLDTVTREEDNIRRIKEIEAAAQGYRDAIRLFAAELQKEEAASMAVLERERKKMDENARAYVTNCEEFLDDQQKELSRNMKERNRKIFLANEVVNIDNGIRVKNYEAQATRDPGLMESGIRNFAMLDEKFAALRKITYLEKNLEVIDAVEESGQEYKQAMTEFLAEWKTLQNLGKARDEAGQEMIDASIILADAGLSETSDIATDTMNSLDRSSAIMVIGLGLALVIGVCLAVFITLSITRPVRRIIDGLNNGAEQVASASSEVSTSSQTLAEGSSEQASSLEETSSSLEEMASMTRRNSENATEGDTMMKETGKVIAEANDSMESLSSSMEEISNSSTEISKIIKDIDEIAFQTNLLALNAAVEAARAGEAGAGFAVVADEVRNLAMRAADAAKNTAELIEGTVTKIDEGARMTTSARESFSKVEQSAQKVGELVGEINSASREQTQGIDQINQAVTDMDKVTQQNAATAEEAASAAEELNAQAEQMTQIVGELTDLVGASGSSGDTKERSPRPHGSAAERSRKQLTQRQFGQSRTNGRKEIAGKGEVRPDQVIPMNDDEQEFSNF